MDDGPNLNRERGVAMSFRDRMFAPAVTIPHWEYLAYKPLEVMGLVFLLHLAFATGWLEATLLAMVVHTAIGQVKWWTSHPFSWWGDRGRGGLLGDVFYHAWIGALPFVALWTYDHYGRLEAFLATLVWLFLWWVWEGMGFGVVRPG
jgi:hypothetical protein